MIGALWIAAALLLACVWGAFAAVGGGDGGER